MPRDPIVLPISRDKLIAAMTPCFGKVKYQLGSKPALTAAPGTFTKSDCSGFFRWLLRWSSVDKSTLAITAPDGSVNQLKWARDMGFRKCPYADCAKADGILRAAFIKARGSRAGHVWLVISGKTIECYGGVGVGRRDWNAAVLKNNVCACFEITGMI